MRSFRFRHTHIYIRIKHPGARDRDRNDLPKDPLFLMRHLLNCIALGNTFVTINTPAQTMVVVSNPHPMTYEQLHAFIPKYITRDVKLNG